MSESNKKEGDWDQLNMIAANVKSLLPDGYGFVVLAFPFGKPAGDYQNRIRYCSNADRKDIINLLKEMMIAWGEEEDWMRHIE
jgi:hypothetical protein